MLFVVVPAAAALAFFTVVGLPASLVALGLMLPLAGLAGFAVAGLRLGRWLLRSRSARPYGAAALGSALLLAVGLVPVAGQVVVLLVAGPRAPAPWPAPSGGSAAGGRGRRGRRVPGRPQAARRPEGAPSR